MKAQSGQAGWVNRAYICFVYPLLEPHSYRGLAHRLRHYEQLEGLSLQENQERQWQALVRLLQYAYDSTLFYRRRFDSVRVHPQEIRSPADLRRIPPLTREDLRDHLPELCSRQYQREELLRAATGGTTDTPVPLLRSLNSVREKAAIHLRFNLWARYRAGDKAFVLWGAHTDLPQNPSWRWRIYDRYLMRRSWAPASLLNEQILESYRKELNRFRPRIIYAYPTPLALFCEYLRNCGRPFHRPVSAICTAEPLLAQQRRVIQQVLGCPVFEMYGSRDFGMIAAQCERQEGLHLNPAAAYVEFLPVKGAETDDLREILVTDLLNDGMLLIRYQINDCALLGPEACSCGCGYPLIKQITGRTADVFQLPNGDRVPGISLHRVITEDCPGLKKIQIIQETVHHFRLRFVRGESFTQADLEILRKRLDQRFGKSVNWGFEQVADIERERSGKTRFCISRLANQASSGPHSAEGEYQ